MASVCYVSYHSREHATTRQHELCLSFYASWSRQGPGTRLVGNLEDGLLTLAGLKFDRQWGARAQVCNGPLRCLGLWPYPLISKVPAPALSFCAATSSHNLSLWSQLSNLDLFGARRLLAEGCGLILGVPSTPSVRSAFGLHTFATYPLGSEPTERQHPGDSTIANHAEMHLRPT